MCILTCAHRDKREPEYTRAGPGNRVHGRELYETPTRYTRCVYFNDLINRGPGQYMRKRDARSLGRSVGSSISAPLDRSASIFRVYLRIVLETLDGGGSTGQVKLTYFRVLMLRGLRLLRSREIVFTNLCVRWEVGRFLRCGL